MMNWGILADVWLWKENNGNTQCMLFRQCQILSHMAIPKALFQFMTAEADGLSSTAVIATKNMLTTYFPSNPTVSSFWTNVATGQQPIYLRLPRLFKYQNKLWYQVVPIPHFCVPLSFPPHISLSLFHLS